MGSTFGVGTLADSDSLAATIGAVADRDLRMCAVDMSEVAAQELCPQAETAIFMATFKYYLSLGRAAFAAGRSVLMPG